MMAMEALHRHWLTADSVRHWALQGIKAEERLPHAPRDANEWVRFASQFLAVSAWYGLLYVVVEGYRRLGVKDDAIDVLLADEVRTDSLQRFRDAVFQYQEDPLSDKMIDVILDKEFDAWANSLNRHFKAFLEQQLVLAAAAEFEK
jgi:hypothetical protein